MENFCLESEFASDYFDSVPFGYIDKTVCGCGLTTVALECNESVVVAMPNVELIKNKICQYPNSRSNNMVLGVYGGVSDGSILSYVENNDIIKILVTYDSLWKCEELILSGKCRLIIDESDRILANTKLKLNGRNNISDISCIDYMLGLAEKVKDTVSFISATPTPLEYLPEWISNIEQVTIEWKNTTTITPMCMKRGRPLSALKDEILAPLNKFGSVTINDIKFSSVIVFINSVNSIKKAIKDTGITNNNEIGIICANNLRNDVKIAGFNRVKDYSALPKYTFITSSGFQGIDLYSKDAMTVVVSSTGNDFQMIDMKIDLKQATSRQRIKSNPTYGKYIYIYNQSAFDSTEEKLLELVDNKKKEITSICDIINTNKGTVGDVLVKYLNDSKDFNEYTIVINEEGNNVKCCVNEMSFNADKYFILETRRQYSKGFKVQNAIDGNTEDINPIVIDNVTYKEMVSYFRDNHYNGVVKWNLLYNPTYAHVIERCFALTGKTYQNYTKAYNVAYNITEVNFDDMKNMVVSNIPYGDYNRKDLKSSLQQVYDNNDIKRTANWKDVFEVYGENKVKMITINGKRLVRISS